MKPEQRTGSLFSKLALEVLTIIFSVLIALGVNEWRTAQANRGLAEHSLDQIGAELEENRRRMQNTLDVHQTLLEDMQKEWIAVAEHPSRDIAYTFNYQQTSLQKRAWQSAIVTQAVEYMDLEKVQRLTDIYELMEAYDAQEERVLSSLGSASFYMEENLANQLRANIFNIELGNQLGALITQRIDTFLDQ